MKKIYLLLAVFLLAVSSVIAQVENINFHFKTLQVDDGLSENAVYCILQDSRGYMWFGTKDGLNRFDGTGFRIFRNTAFNTSSLGNNFVRSIIETDDGNLFVGTDAGLYYMDVVHETFCLVQSKTQEDISVTSEINTLYKDPDQNIWIGTMRQGIFRYNHQTGALQKVEIELFEHGEHAVWSIYGDKSGIIWAGSRMGLLRYNPLTMIFDAVDGLFHPVANYGHEILCIHEDINGNLWLGTWGHGIKFYNKQHYDGISYYGNENRSLYITHIRAIYPYDEKHLLIGADDGLFLFNMDSRSIKRIDIPLLKNSMSDQNVYSLAGDRENGLWIGTYFGGVNYVNASNRTIETYYPDVQDGMLSGKAVSQFCEDKDGNLWIATEDGGINYFNPQTKQITQPIKTTYHNTHALLWDGDNLLIGTFSRGIDIYNTRTGKLTNFRNNPTDTNSLNDDCIFSLYKTRKGDMYAGTPLGLNRYDRNTNSFVRVNEVFGFVYDIKEDDSGNLWLALYDLGVMKLDATTGEWVNYNTLLPLNNPIVNSKLTSIYIDNRKRVIFTSEGRGLFLYDYKTDGFRNISEADGLPNNVVYGVLDDSFGNLWMSCNRGIVCFNTEKPAEYKLFDKSDGLQSNQFNYKSSYKAKNGKFYFGGINGFSSFYPQNLVSLHNPAVPAVEITDIQLLDDADPKRQSDIRVLLNKKEKIRLPYNQSSFTISYVSLSYQSQSKNQYAYRLEGIDRDWKYAGNNKSVTYVGLSPGNYVFHVKASNNDGIWNEEGTVMTFEILPPFWLSIPAKIIYLFLIATSIYLLLRYYWNRNKQKQTRQLEEFKMEQEKLSVKSKLDFFTTIAHEIRTPVSLIKAPLEEVLLSGDGNEETKQNLSIIEKNSNRLNLLINQLLDFRKIDSMKYTVNPEKINLKQCIQELFERFRKTAQKNKIDFVLETIEDVELYAISDQDALTKIVGNLLTNALKYTTDKIILKLEKKNIKEYIISVEDNGIGVADEHKSLIFDPFYQVNPESGKGTGVGLSLVKSLTPLLNGRIDVSDSDSGGAVFTFTFTDLEMSIVSDNQPVEKGNETEMVNYEILKDRKASILVVDDNPDITAFIVKCLRNDYKVESALHASDAWLLLEKGNFDLIISDIMMPDIDGISFTKKIKADINFSHIPVVLLSAKTENTVKVEGLQSGAEVFIEKPFSTSFLKAQILSLLENRKTVRETFNRSPWLPYSTLVSTKSDEAFLTRLNEEIEKNISDENFSVESLTDVLSISRSNFQRKLKGICGVTPGEYLRNYRLRKACHLLIETPLRINEVAFQVGFNSASYFTKAFIKCYKVSPKEFVQSNKIGDGRN
ncbi:MAG: response regulator [Tannerella sp.]|nr:response regulator [Tannerella sp.]